MKDKVDQLKEMLQGKAKQPEKETETAAAEDALQKDLQAAQEEAKQHYDKWLRVMADFENYKKRVAKDHEERLQFGNENLIQALIPVLDDFDRVLDHLPEKVSEEMQGLIQGVQIVQKHFAAALQKFGVEAVEALHKPFDPHLHESIGHVESDAVPEGAVATEHRKGYLLHGRLIRPALVTVAKNKKTS